jgi:hypothetical protein
MVILKPSSKLTSNEQLVLLFANKTSKLANDRKPEQLILPSNSKIQ